MDGGRQPRHRHFSSEERCHVDPAASFDDVPGHGVSGDSSIYHWNRLVTMVLRIFNTCFLNILLKPRYRVKLGSLF